MKAGIRDYATLVKVSLLYLVAAIVGSGLVGIILLAASYILTRDFRASLTISLIVIGMGVLMGILGSIIKIWDGVKSERQVRKYLGPHTYMITPYVERSADGTRQCRMTPLDARHMREAHYHLERLSSNRALITENYLWGEPHQTVFEERRDCNRLVSLIKQSEDKQSPIIHYIGSPLLQAGLDAPKHLPKPHVLLLEIHDSECFLFRFTKNGRYAGDTWHQNLAEAMQQAEYEYAKLLSEWLQVPTKIENFSQLIKWLRDR